MIISLPPDLHSGCEVDIVAVFIFDLARVHSGEFDPASWPITMLNGGSDASPRILFKMSICHSDRITQTALIVAFYRH